MSPELVGAVGIGVLLVFLFLGVPLGICMIFVGIVGFAIIAGPNQALFVAATTTASTIKSYTLSVLPVFLIMGEFGSISGMMTEAYDSANAWLGRLPGGLAMASVVGASLFSCISGSSMACAAIMTRVALPSLLKYEYDPKLTTGALCAGGSLGNIVPPGVILVIYAMLTEVSLGKFFIACYIPGFLLTFMYLVQIYLQCKINPSLGPLGARSTWKQKLSAIKGIAPVFIVLVTVLGGIQFGVFTPNEAASVATVFVFLYALIRKTLTRQNILKAFKDTLVTTGMFFCILIGANMFGYFIAMSGLSQGLATWMTGLGLSAIGVVIFIMVIYFILGIPLDAVTTMLLTLPTFLPLLNAYNIDLLWFGVLCILQCELASLTPPVGMYLFVVAGMVKQYGISMNTVFKGAIPFCITCTMCVVICIAFPQISLWLVSLMR